MEENLQVLKLHENPQYLQQCCQLINDEWPRSETARMLSLTSSCDKLPTSLVLINSGNLIGHAKLTAIPAMSNSCFIETVVISKSMRGKKLGTFLMKEVEKYCKNVLKLEMVHLSTKGQEDFYSKLGYVICAPVSIYGCAVNKDSMFETKSIADNAVIVNNFPPAPPPPPMPKPQIVNSSMKSSRTFMFKYL